ncbi:electron transfer flavoprotein subunit alpha/FixB family protein [Dehalobacter sp. DCM]|uniref:electron transfer flavoprotein subunit alpha/FixB family protein n=1 Tax=Dehalobacter sp. DCM TaxID=2907827 RepID=UPI0030814514|nr:electron transfer flavoprotein subunit alpha/FixB family protein [Dehalobacter sp. DCM]
MAGMKNIWVFADKKDAILELCAGGRTLGDKVTALVIAPRTDAEQVIAGGADQVYWLGDKQDGKLIEDYFAAIFDLIQTQKPDVVLLGTTKRCKLMAGRLAARLGTSALMDVMEFSATDNGLQAKRMVYGGAAVRTESSAADLTIATVGPGVFEKLPEDSGRQGTIEDVAAAAGSAITCVEKRPKVGESVNLAAAKRVVAVGRGIANKEDLKMIEELAGLLGAEIGCSRPLAEGVDWLPRERYIGVSGVMFKPDLYIGIGISGQIQHMVGCNQAKTIVAINKDKAAPIFQQADYGIVGDLYKAIPALIEVLKK